MLSTSRNVMPEVRLRISRLLPRWNAEIVKVSELPDHREITSPNSSRWPMFIDEAEKKATANLRGTGSNTRRVSMRMQ